MQIDGGFFKNQKLVLSDGESTTTSTFEMNYIPSETYNKMSNANILEIPLYTNLLREDFLCFLQVQFVPSKADVIYSGAAFVIPEIQ